VSLLLWINIIYWGALLLLFLSLPFSVHTTNNPNSFGNEPTYLCKRQAVLISIISLFHFGVGLLDQALSPVTQPNWRVDSTKRIDHSAKLLRVEFPSSPVFDFDFLMGKLADNI